MAQDMDELLAKSLAMQDFMEFDESNLIQTTTHNHNIHKSDTQILNQNPPPQILHEQCLPSILRHYLASKSIIDLSDDINSTNPDIFTLFRKYNILYFDGALSQCEVKWSKRMTLCAGLCCYEGYGGLCSIKLSSPLLQYRSTKEMIETLLHEMVHAFLFVSVGSRDRESHGVRFKTLMNVINYVSGLNLSVYHTFHDEVDEHRKHIWKCSGSCTKKPPYFGLVKRAMNRKPGPNDSWWARHQKECGGTYTKISEPKEFTEKMKKKKEREFRKKEREERKAKGIETKTKKKKRKKRDNGQTLLDMFGSVEEPKKKKQKVMELTEEMKEDESDLEILDVEMKRVNTVNCPICGQMVAEKMINEHLDACL